MLRRASRGLHLGLRHWKQIPPIAPRAQRLGVRLAQLRQRALQQVALPLEAPLQVVPLAPLQRLLPRPALLLLLTSQMELSLELLWPFSEPH